MPGALVPALASLQSAPARKCIASARAAEVVVPLDPEQLAGGVADRDQQAGLGRALDQQPSDQRHRRRQRVVRADLGQLVVGQPDPGSGELGIQTRHQAAPPGVDDDATQGPVHVAGLHEVVVDLVQ